MRAWFASEVVKDAGVSGLAADKVDDVVAEGGDNGLDVLYGDKGLGDSSGRLVVSANSAGLGFHELRWKLFFFRTLALYAARMAAVASWVLMEKVLAETTLGVRPFDENVVAVAVVTSRRDNEIGAEEAGGGGRGDTGGDGEEEVQVS